MYPAYMQPLTHPIANFEEKNNSLVISTVNQKTFKSDENINGKHFEITSHKRSCAHQSAANFLNIWQIAKKTIRCIRYQHYIMQLDQTVGGVGTLQYQGITYIYTPEIMKQNHDRNLRTRLMSDNMGFGKGPCKYLYFIKWSVLEQGTNLYFQCLL